MNSEKQVKDITEQELKNIVKNKEECIAYKLNCLLQQRLRIEREIDRSKEFLVKTNAKITELEGLTVEEAYELIQKENCSSLSSSVWSLGDAYSGVLVTSSNH